jgi:hypothetical protein
VQQRYGRTPTLLLIGFHVGAHHRQRLAEISLVPQVVAHRKRQPHELIHASSAHRHDLPGGARRLQLVPLAMRSRRPLRVDLVGLCEQLSPSEQRQLRKALPGPRPGGAKPQRLETLPVEFGGFARVARELRKLLQLPGAQQLLGKVLGLLQLVQLRQKVRSRAARHGRP